jgi:hypothetical protein
MITEEPRLILSALMMTCGWVMYISRVSLSVEPGARIEYALCLVD